MSNHTCIRCGHESHCSHRSWPDRHPLAAVLFAVPVSIVALGAIVAYPWLLAVLAAAGLAYVVDREHRRRAALSARADWEHHTLMARPIPPVRVHYARGTRAATVAPAWSAHPAPWHLVSQLPTEPMLSGRNR